MGATTAGVVAAMLIAMLNSTFLLVAIFKYDCKKRDISFENFWRRRCDEDWQLAFSAFTYGIPLFLVMLAQVGWVVFWSHEERNIASSFVTAIALITLLFWSVSTKYKWGSILKKGHRKLTLRNPNEHIHNNNNTTLHNRVGAGPGAGGAGAGGLAGPTAGGLSIHQVDIYNDEDEKIEDKEVVEAGSQESE